MKIDAIHVPDDVRAQLAKPFAGRAYSVHAFHGFEGFQLLRPVPGEKRYFVVSTSHIEANYEARATGPPGRCTIAG